MIVERVIFYYNVFKIDGFDTIISNKSKIEVD